MFRQGWPILTQMLDFSIVLEDLHMSTQIIIAFYNSDESQLLISTLFSKYQKRKVLILMKQFCRLLNNNNVNNWTYLEFALHLSNYLNFTGGPHDLLFFYLSRIAFIDLQINFK